MSKVSEIEAQYKYGREIGRSIDEQNARYLLGLVKEVRNNLREHIRQCVNGGPSLCDVCSKSSYLLYRLDE